MHVRGTRRSDPVNFSHTLPAKYPPRLMDLETRHHPSSRPELVKEKSSPHFQESRFQDRFLDHVKSLEEQLLKINSKLQQLDSNYNQLNQQSQAYLANTKPHPSTNSLSQPMYQPAHPYYHQFYPQSQLDMIPVPPLRQ